MFEPKTLPIARGILHKNLISIGSAVFEELESKQRNGLIIS